MKKYFLLFVLIIQVIIFMIIDDYFYRKNKEKIDNFKHNISNLLGDKKEVVVTASELTSFSWEKLCFERVDSYFEILGESFILLSFDYKTLFKLNYKDYYLEEAYVDGSLDGKCVASKDRIILKNYGRILFSSID